MSVIILRDVHECESLVIFTDSESFGQFEEIFVLTDEGEVKHQATRSIKKVAPIKMKSNVMMWHTTKTAKADKKVVKAVAKQQLKAANMVR